MFSQDSAATSKTEATTSTVSKGAGRARLRPLFAFAGIAGLGLALQSAAAVPQAPKFKKSLAPEVRITSPLDGAFIAPGDGQVGAGTFNGSGFMIVAEIRTRDKITVTVDEDVNIRHVEDLGGFNPQFPRLIALIDEDMITPNGTIIPANTNLAPLFNIAGTDDTPGPGVTTWVGWHV